MTAAPFADSVPASLLGPIPVLYLADRLGAPFGPVAGLGDILTGAGARYMRGVALPSEF